MTQNSFIHKLVLYIYIIILISLRHNLDTNHRPVHHKLDVDVLTSYISFIRVPSSEKGDVTALIVSGQSQHSSQGQPLYCETRWRRQDFGVTKETTQGGGVSSIACVLIQIFVYTVQ